MFYLVDCFNAIVRLNSAIPEWQIVFDNGEKFVVVFFNKLFFLFFFSEIDGTLCDCENCCS